MTTDEWIFVSDRQPEEADYYLTTIDYGKYGVAVGQRYYHGKVVGWEDDCVIAWMPLPKPCESKMGHWIDMDTGFSPCECSECGAVEFNKSNYCPNCGMKMKP